MQIRMAFDRSLRRTDVDGRLHVEATNISKAMVCPYLGSEIPRAEELGLDPGRVYYLFRDPVELAAAAPSFNNIPLLSQHVPVSAADHQPGLVVGSMGTDAEYVAPYLKNSLVIWEAAAIAGVESREQCELSCAYRYDADMTPGEFEGVRYDGVMRNLIGNHVALVETGRAGPDVVVADSFPFQEVNMKLSRTALAAIAALGAVIRPKLAADSALPSLLPVLQDTKKANLDPAKLSATVLALVAPKLAADAKLTAEELAGAVKFATDGVADEPDAPPADDPTGANDEDEEDEDGEKVSKKAMDAAIAKARATGATEAVARMNAIRQAERDVHPFVGEVAAMDSAEAVYKFALDAQGVNTAGMDPVAFRHVLAALPKPGTAPAKVPAMAADSADLVADFKTRFPTAVAPRRS
jgi:uncharacterized protein